MAACLTFVEPAPTQLQDWFSNARIGDECQIVTPGKKQIMSLTKAGLSMVWWLLPHIGRQEKGFTLSIPFTEVLQTWTVAQGI